MANSVLEKISKSNDSQSGYAAPDYDVIDGKVFNGPVSSSEFMTKAGFIRAFTINMILVSFFAAVGWKFHQLAIVALFISIPLVLVGAFAPKTTRIVGPLYAITQGLVVGAVSKFYEASYDGIVIQAMVLTITILTVVTYLHQSGIIKVTDKFIRIIMFATMGIAVFYMANFIMSMFGGNMPLIWDSGLLGIGFSVVVTLLAVSNFLVDLELVDRSAKNNAPKYFESALAFGMTVSVVWVYLEILRLLSKIRN
jgi:uncharacterized YccA/Bax inhibitor family protein